MYLLILNDRLKHDLEGTDASYTLTGNWSAQLNYDLLNFSTGVSMHFVGYLFEEFQYFK